MIKKLNWDSDFFGLQIGEITDFSEVENQRDFDLIYAKSATNHSLRIPGFENSFSETKVVFSKKLQSVSSDSQNIRLATQQDSVSDLYELAYESGKFSRFKQDERFGRDHFEKLYSVWVDNSLNKQFADELILFKKDNKIAGFVTYKSAATSASIGLIAVSSNFQGQGIGTQLLQYVESKLVAQNITELQIPTQLENKPACAFYSKHGYEITETTYLKHYWKI